LGRARRILVGVTPVGRNIAEIIDARSVSQNHLLAAKSRICECQIVQVFNDAVVPDKGAVLKIPIQGEADHLTELVNGGGLAVCAAKAAEVDFLAVLQQEWGTCGCRAATIAQGNCIVASSRFDRVIAVACVDVVIAKTCVELVCCWRYLR